MAVSDLFLSFAALAQGADTTGQGARDLASLLPLKRIGYRIHDILGRYLNFGWKHLGGSGNLLGFLLRREYGWILGGCQGRVTDGIGR